MSERNSTFDVLRGILILSVILGHLLPGPLDETPERQVIYFIHMPLFLAVTGFFVKEQNLRWPLRSVLLKYYDRMLLPYLLAFPIFTAFLWHEALNEGTFGLRTIARSFFKPHYHLWYVPAVLLFVLATKLILRARWRFTVVIAGLIAGSTACLYEAYGQSLERQAWMSWLGDRRFIGYYAYFLAGYLLGSHANDRRLLAIALPVLGCGPVMLRFASSPLPVAILEFSTKIAIIVLALFWCAGRSSTKDSLIARVGQVSLPIYLWHALPLIILQGVLPDGGPIYYALALAASSIVVASCVGLKGRYPLLDRLVFGSRARSQNGGGCS